MKLKSKFPVTVSLDIVKPREYFFELLIQSDEKPMKLNWNANVAEKVIADDESLENWKACWRGRQSWKDNKTEFEIFFPNHNKIRSFGEVRATLLNQKK